MVILVQSLCIDWLLFFGAHKEDCSDSQLLTHKVCTQVQEVCWSGTLKCCELQCH